MNEEVVMLTVHEHAVIRNGLIIAKCGIPHGEPFPWTECPVAKTWTLMNAARLR